ncbi:terminase small subunit [Deinococcus irradiatisoli]|uniref:Terminase small subunit n=1 Tax=Deinococcus irradiatisoli TaxID=2202254 RepID=A0A2Z3JAR4_9DEIO|nr:terminase small subunit [Deinococcus irradiatisoli]AWN22197.1 terminase small subunit [Deinococcus irradiatisoli]
MTRKAREARPKGRTRQGKRSRKPAHTPKRKLTAQQERFAVEYIVDYNATQAAIRASYSPKTASQIGYQLLQKTSVLAAVERAQAQALTRAGVRKDAVLLELAKIGFSSQRHLLQADEDGNVHLRPGAEIPEDAWDAVKSITAIDNETESESESPNGGTRHSRSRQRTISVVMHDKRAALVDLGRHLGIFAADKLEVTGKDGSAIQQETTLNLEGKSIEELTALYKSWTR